MGRKAPAAAAAPAPPSFEDLRASLADAGAVVGELDLAEFEGAGGRGLVAREAATAGAELLRIPLRCCLHNSVEESPEALRAPLRWATEEGRWPDGAVVSLALSLRIWFEMRSPSSPVFAAYMPFLLTGCDVSLFPHRWSAAQVTACGPMSSVPIRRQELFEVLKRLKRQLLATVAEFPDVFSCAPSDKEVEWLHCCCTSRARTLDGVHILAPVGDLANHAEEGALLDAALDEAGEVVTFRLTGAIDAGSQVMCSYRKNTANEELVINFAFALPGNRHTMVPLKLQVTGDGAAMKTEMLQELELDRFLQDEGDGKKSIVAVLRETDPFPNALVAISRVLVSIEKVGRDELLQQVSQKSGYTDKKWVPILLGVLASHLRLYPLREESQEPWDVIYNDYRSVLKKAMEHLLHLQKQLS